MLSGPDQLLLTSGPGVDEFMLNAGEVERRTVEVFRAPGIPGCRTMQDIQDSCSTHATTSLAGEAINGACPCKGSEQRACVALVKKTRTPCRLAGNAGAAWLVRMSLHTLARLARFPLSMNLCIDEPFHLCRGASRLGQPHAWAHATPILVSLRAGGGVYSGGVPGRGEGVSPCLATRIQAPATRAPRRQRHTRCSYRPHSIGDCARTSKTATAWRRQLALLVGITWCYTKCHTLQ